MIWLQTTSSLLNISQAWFGDNIGQRPISPGNCIQPHCLESKNLIMWTHASLCQLASELDNSHRHVSYRCGLRACLSYTKLLPLLSSLPVCISFQITRRIYFLCEVRYLSELLTDQSYSLVDLLPLLFDFLCLASLMGLLNYKTMKNIYFFFHVTSKKSFFNLP